MLSNPHVHPRDPSDPSSFPSEVAPLFSSTMWMSSESYRDLVEESSDSWLLLFYSDSSDTCKDFLPRWEALAQKLPPMVRLGRVNVDQNLGTHFLQLRVRSHTAGRSHASVALKPTLQRSTYLTQCPTATTITSHATKCTH